MARETFDVRHAAWTWTGELPVGLRAPELLGCSASGEPERTCCSSSSVIAMAYVRLTAAFGLLTVLLGLFFSRSPLQMASSPPSKTWADSPMKLIATPQVATGKVGSSPPPWQEHKRRVWTAG